MVRVLAALLLALPLAACSEDTDDAGRPELLVLAAASLTDVFEELAVDFEQEHDVDVVFSFGSSTDLAAQAADGAPGDVLATADETAMQLAEDAGVADDARDFATNRLVIVTPPDNPTDVQSLDDLPVALWVRCADEVPCGRVARSVLDDAGVTAQPVSLEDDARATLDKVTSGEAEAGLVYATDAVAVGDAVTTIEISGATEHRTTYVATVLEQSEQPALARAWVDQLGVEAGRRALRDAGFTTP